MLFQPVACRGGTVGLGTQEQTRSLQRQLVSHAIDVEAAQLLAPTAVFIGQGDRMGQVAVA